MGGAPLDRSGYHDLIVSNMATDLLAVISGPEAPQPLTEFENVTSNCWPILPKTDTLTAAESLIERVGTHESLQRK